MLSSGVIIVSTVCRRIGPTAIPPGPSGHFAILRSGNPCSYFRPIPRPWRRPYNEGVSYSDFKAIIREPRVPNPPRRVWRDWALVGLAVPAAIVESFVNPEIEHPLPSLILTLVLLPLLLWRRTDPLTVVLIGFGMTLVSNLWALTGGEPLGLYTLAVVLVLPYCLFRWASGREAMIGLALILLTWIVSVAVDWNGVGEAIGGLLVVLFPAQIGAVVRYQSNNRRQAIERARSSPREQLARELHDTVAHHVSAIAIQAQGGRAMAAKNPERAFEVLSVIEEEAARALAEMRSMVGALRDGDSPTDVELAPQPGLADIERLTEIGTGPPIDVELAGDLEGLRPAVDTALYRLAQESITNAVRHARNATRVLVRVVGDNERVELTVTDDGVHNPAPSSVDGYGLIGMAERAKLMGGTVSAGPDVSRGWKVRAVLPRNGDGDAGAAPAEGLMA